MWTILQSGRYLFEQVRIVPDESTAIYWLTRNLKRHYTCFFVRIRPPPCEPYARPIIVSFIVEHWSFKDVDSLASLPSM